jgi:MGT family glycosyltransferase
MSSYLFTSPDGGGTVPPTLSVAGALAARGHDVRVLGDPVLQPEVEAAGCAFVPWTTAPHRHVRTPDSEIIRDWEARTPLGGFAMMRDEIITGPAGRFARDILEELERRPVDAIVSELVLAGAQIAAEVARLPLAYLITTVYPLPVKGRPPFGPGFAPAQGPLGRARDALFAAVGRAMWNRGLPDLNAARKQFGLEPLDYALGYAARADRILVLTSEKFEFPADELPPHVRYVGPRLADPAWAAEWTPPPGEDPLVLVGLSSTHQGQRPALGRIAQALGTLPVRALITTGPTIPPEVANAPPNVTVVGSAPHDEVLRQAAVAITHAGHGTTIKALAHGVPVVAMPMGRDQGDVAARVVAAGAGVRVRPGASPRKIAAAVAEVLAHPSYRDGARRLARVIAEDTAEDRAVTELESLVAYAAKNAASSSPIRSGASSWRKWPQSGSAVTSA